MKRLLFFVLPLLIIGVIVYRVDWGNDKTNNVSDNRSSTPVSKQTRSVPAAPLSTHSVTTSRQDSDIARMTLLQIDIGRGAYGSDREQLVYRSVQMLADMQEVVGYNIVAALQESEEDDTMLDNYLVRLRRVRDESALVQHQWGDISERSQEKYDACLQKKKEGDEMFFAGITSYTPKQASAGYRRSREYASCVTTHRLETNVAKVFTKQFDYLRRLIDDKYTLLSSKRTAVIEDNGLFKGTYLEELIQIRDKARSYIRPDEL